GDLVRPRSPPRPAGGASRSRRYPRRSGGHPGLRRPLPLLSGGLGPPMTLYLEDFHPGDEAESGSRTVTREAIVAFAREFDPQPLHLDEEAAKRSPYG